MARVEYDDGTVIEFDGDPTPEQIEEAYATVKGAPAAPEAAPAPAQADQLEAALTQQTQAEQQQAAAAQQQQQAAAAKDADPTTWSTTRLKDHFRKTPPRTIEEQAQMNALMEGAKVREQQLTDQLLGRPSPEQEQQLKVEEKAAQEQQERSATLGQSVGEAIKQAGIAGAGLEEAIGSTVKWAGDALVEASSALERSSTEPRSPVTAKATRAVDEAAKKLTYKVGSYMQRLGSDSIAFWRDVKLSEKLRPDPEFWRGKFFERNTWQKSLALGAGAIPSFGAAAAITVATKNPWAGAGVLGTVYGATEYQAARDAGKGVGDASLVGASNAVFSTVTERLPLGQVLKAGNPITKAAVVGVQEGLEEVVQQLWTNAVAKFGYDRTRDYFENVVESGVAGMVSGGVVGGMTPGTAGKVEAFEAQLKAEGMTPEQIETMRGSVIEQVVANGETIQKALDEKGEPTAPTTPKSEATPAPTTSKGEAGPAPTAPESEAKPPTIAPEHRKRFERILQGFQNIKLTEEQVQRNLVNRLQPDELRLMLELSKDSQAPGAKVIAGTIQKHLAAEAAKPAPKAETAGYTALVATIENEPESKQRAAFKALPTDELVGLYHHLRREKGGYGGKLELPLQKAIIDRDPYSLEFAKLQPQEAAKFAHTYEGAKYDMGRLRATLQAQVEKLPEAAQTKLASYLASKYPERRPFPGEGPPYGGFVDDLLMDTPEAQTNTLIAYVIKYAKKPDAIPAGATPQQSYRRSYDDVMQSLRKGGAASGVVGSIVREGRLGGVSAEQVHADLVKRGYSAQEATELVQKEYRKPAEAQPTAPEPTKPKTQKELVKEVVKEAPKSIEQVQQETGIKRENIRRILGVGTKAGEFVRVDKGVYVLTDADGRKIAHVETADALEALQRQDQAGRKYDMIFLDPPYYSSALVGGNRGIKDYTFINPNYFKSVMQVVGNLVASDDTHVYLMLSGAPSAQQDMAKYATMITNTGFRVVGEGRYAKLTKAGKPVTNVRGRPAAPERLILLTKSGQAKQGEIPVGLEFAFVRPSIATSYTTEKPLALLKALIKQSTLEGEAVLDPFAGSGVTGEAAVEEGRTVALIEKREEQAEAIKARVKRALDRKVAKIETEADRESHALQGKTSAFTVDQARLDESPGEAVPQDVDKLAASNWDVQLPVEPTTKERVNKTQIVDFVEKAFGVPIRDKLTRQMGRLREQGVYLRQPELIRLKVWGELEVLSHEVSHHLDIGILRKQHGDRWYETVIPPGLQKQGLRQVRQLDYNYPKEARFTEGFAEFMRHYLTDTGEAIQKAPIFHEWFQAWLADAEPEVLKKLERTRQLYKVWKQQGALNRVLGQIDFRGEHTKRPLMERLRAALDTLTLRMQDELYVLKKMEASLGLESRKTLRPSQSAYEMATYMKQKASGIARTYVETAAIDEYGNVIGPSLVEILKPVEPAKLKEFIAYWVSRRALHLEGRRGMESGFDLNDAKAIIQQYDNPTWNQVAEDLTAWSNHAVEWMVRAGGLSPEVAEAFRVLNPIYAPFKRAFLDEGPMGRGGKLFSPASPFKRIHGSGRPILNPMETMVQQMTQAFSRAHKIRLANVIVDLAGKEGAGAWVAELPLAQHAITLRTATVLESLGKQVQDAELLKELGDEGFDEFMTIFTANADYRGKGNVVPVFRQGKLKLYELHPELYRALQGLEPIQLGPVLRVLSAFTRLLRLGATQINPSFGSIRNPARDFPTYALYSKKRAATPLDPFKGIVQELTAKPGSFAWRFKAAGGDLSSMMGYDRAQTMSVLDDALLANLGKKGKALKIVKHPIDTFRRIVNIPEMGPRITEGTASMERYAKERKDWSAEDVFIAAFNDAQDITVNFTRSGTLGKQINQAAFAFNASIQGINKFYRELQTNPIRTIVRGFVWLTIPALVQWWRNKDEDWYKNLDPRFKYNNLFIELDDEVFRLPIPYDLGTMFAALPVAVADIDYWGEQVETEAIQGLVDIMQAQVPDPTPNIIGPVLDVLANRNYLGNPIESLGMQYLPPEQRVRPDTPGYAKFLSRGFNTLGIELSPVQVEHLVNNYTGGLARTAGRPLKLEEAPDLPVVGGQFLRYPERPSFAVDQFYTRLGALRQGHSADTLTAQEEQERSRLEKFERNQMKASRQRLKAAQARQDRDAIRREYQHQGRLLKGFGFGLE